MRVYKLVVFCSMIGGCTTLQVPPKTLPSRATIEEWRVDGAFSFQSNAQPRIMAHFSWEQQEKFYTIQIRSSLGLYKVVIQGMPGRVTLQDTKHSLWVASSPEILMRQHLGWDLPVSELKDWVMGRPAPHLKIKQAQYDLAGHLTALQQLGWRIYFSRYKRWGSGDFPGMIDIRSQDMKMRISLKKRSPKRRS